MPPSQPVVQYHDDFTGYPTGSFPTGFVGGGSQVEPDPLGFYPRVCQMGPNEIFRSTGKQYAVSLFYGFCANSGDGIFAFSFANGPQALGNQTERIVDLIIEEDFSISCRRGSVIVGNSGASNLYINPYGWNYVQVNCQIGTFARAGDGVVCISVTMDLGLNGNTCFSGQFKEFPDLPVASMWDPEPIFNMWLFAGLNLNGGPIANVYLCNLTELNVFPFDFDSMGNYLPKPTGPSGSHALITQGFLEAVELPEIGDDSTTDLRVSQGFIEVVELPVIHNTNPVQEFPNLRISQAFIELMTESGSTPVGSQGSRVYEA
jgi:hypothetical protein